jgi:uncharacterized repeat protein (TIGR01451 family)
MSFRKTLRQSTSNRWRMQPLRLVSCLSVTTLFCALSVAQTQPDGPYPGVASEQLVITLSDLPSESSSLQHDAPFISLRPKSAAPVSTSSTNELQSATLGPSPALCSICAFNALGDDGTQTPPDTDGAVGPNHLVIALNSQLRVQDRSGGTILTTSLNTFFGALAQPLGAFDPHIVYDKFNDRWIIAAVANQAKAQSRVLVGVTATGDPTGMWILRSIVADPTGVNWADYPLLGFNKNWVVVTVDMQPISGTGPINSNVYYVNKADLYSGATPQFNFFSTVPEAVASADQAIAPALTYDNSAESLFLLEDYNGSVGTIRQFAILGPVGSETFKRLPNVVITNTWSDTTPLVPEGFAPQLGVTDKIDAGDARISSVVYRNGFLWATHTVFLPASNPTHSAVQWLQVKPGSSTPQQQGRIEDLTATDTSGMFFGYPSIAVNKNNDILIGYSSFSATQYASADYAFRFGTDAANGMRSDTQYKSGVTSFIHLDRHVHNRWGDFSTATVDPVNDVDMWTIQEYAAQHSLTAPTSRWGTWWAHLLVPIGPTTHIAVVTPAAATVGIPFPITVTALDEHNETVTTYTGTLHFTSPDRAAVLPSDTALVNGTGTLTVTLNTAGLQSIVATDTANSQITGNAKVRVNGPDLIISKVSSANPISGGSSLAYTISVANIGFAGAENVKVTDTLPAGVVFQSCSATCSASANNVIVSLGTLGISAEMSLTITVRLPLVSVETYITNSATVSTTTSEISTSNNSASQTTAVFPGSIPQDTWAQRFPATSPGGPFGPTVESTAMAYDSIRAEVLLFGGLNNVAPLNDTWVWRGGNWLHKTPASQPPARYGHAVAFDAARGQIVMFGGESLATLADTWIWDGSNWTQKFPKSSPPARLGHAMTYDQAHAKVVLFGGETSSTGGYLNDTWSWNGSNWTKESPLNNPPAAAFHAMTYDLSRFEILLFGGSGVNGLSNDIWSWNGSDWNEKSVSVKPPARWGHSLAYDASRGQSVLFGGENSTNTDLNDTWLWNGSSWTQDSPAVKPPARHLLAFAYDVVEDKILMFGGLGFEDSWLWPGASKIAFTVSPAMFGNDQMSAFSVNPSSGALTQLAGFPVSLGSIFAQHSTVDQAGKFLFISEDSTDSVGVFSINQKSGALVQVPGSPFFSGPGTSVPVLHPTGKFLFVTNVNTTGGDSVAAYRVSPNGALTPVIGSPFPAGVAPYGAVVHPGGRFLYVTDLTDTGGNVMVFSVNSTTGALSRVSGSPFAACLFCQALVIDPQGRFLYGSSGTGSYIAGAAINPATGVPSPLSGSPFSTAGLSPGSLAMSPTGKLLFAGNQVPSNQPGSVSVFTIDPSTGALAIAPGSPVAVGTGSTTVAADPSGELLYVTDSSSELTVFSVNNSTGALTRITSHSTPANPADVSATN